MEESQTFNLIKSYVGFNLGSAVKEAIETNKYNDNGYLTIMVTEFFDNYVYLDFLANRITGALFNRYRPQIMSASKMGMQEVISKYVTLDDIAKYAAVLHPLAYRDFIDERNKELEQNGTFSR